MVIKVVEVPSAVTGPVAVIFEKVFDAIRGVLFWELAIGLVQALPKTLSANSDENPAFLSKVKNPIILHSCANNLASGPTLILPLIDEKVHNIEGLIDF